ncbi:MAG: PAS domain S-box protein [Acidobacteriia bacterium]|nr:PAS domain S-box protein [Terriglobia bacterium]
MQTRVLLIEDNPLDARLILELLKDAGADVELECVDRLSKGCERLSAQPADAVILDLTLPDSAGFDTFSQLHAKFPEAPVVVLTGLNDQELALRAVRSGAQDYFVKGDISGPILARALKYAIERKRVEAALLEREKDLNEAQRLAHMGSWQLTPETGACAWSEGMFRIFGLDLMRPAPTYQEQERFMSADSWKGLAAAINRTSQTGSPGELVLDIIRSDGSHRWLEVRMERRRAKNGQEALLCGTAQDISELRQAEETIRLQASQHETLVSTTSEGYWRFDAEGKLLDINEAYCRMSGYSRDELLKLHIAGLEAAEKSEDIRSHIQRIRDKGFERYESQHRKKNGEVFDVEVSATFWKASGQFLAFTRDISERKQVQRALEASEHRFRAIYERSPIGMALVDSISGRFLRVNPKYCEVVGRPENEMLQMDFESLVHPDDLPSVREHCQELFDGRIRFFELEQRFIRPRGAPVWVNLTVVPMWSEGEAVTYHLAMVEDITERKRADEVLLKRLSQIVLRATA